MKKQALSRERRAQLDGGEAEATHLAEILAVDFARLLASIAPSLPAAAVANMRKAANSGITLRMQGAATLLRAHALGDPAQWIDHRSDTVRGWACYLIGSDPRLSLEHKLDALRALADDPHFGVREWAWLAVRPHIAADPLRVLAHVQPWTADASPNVRRFACEALRPRGVWAAHIALLKQAPQHAHALLEALCCDESRYVQDSVGNWLNDAGKSQPDWVRERCAAWQQRHADHPANTYIRKRAQRSL
ncbi:DNA alkylation repair protein [Stenotrophomonas rhizophila]|uniref:DNA alkylation repair protein n=1 Tax=Stenotrophomonas nematodicola TaxID=2656746 RepID=A0ABW7D4Z5_9GAMM|nr:DNA alkylation repair protein [Stenotrophomonas sp. BIGb0135]MCS4236909.1 3-methyladenine DNA glycosylase AlkC [Stenotrophomonas sp. BIGb0135]